ncbi:MAG: hypothetical protein AAGB34_01165 [Planctomycetota bacterium]
MLRTACALSLAAISAVAGSAYAQVFIEDGQSNTINSRITNVVVVRDSAGGTPTAATIVNGGDLGRGGFAFEISLFVEGTSSVVLDGGRIRRSVVTLGDSLFRIESGIVNQDVYIDQNSRFIMNGGTAGFDVVAFATGSSTLNGGTIRNDFAVVESGRGVINGGTVENDVVALGDGFIEIFDGILEDDLIAENRAVINMFGGSLDDDVEAGDDSIVRLFGGSFGEDVEAFAGGRIEIFGGTFAANGIQNQDSGIASGGTSTIVISGTDFEIDGQAVGFGEIVATSGVLTGTLSDGSSLNSNILRVDEQGTLGTIILVPTPGSAVLLALGGALAGIRRRR